MLKYLRLTPEFQRWNNQVPLTSKGDSKAFQVYRARVDQTLVAVDLFWPEFIDHDGLVLRKSAIPENWNEYIHQVQQAQWSPRTVEYTINHIHISDEFMNDPDRDAVDPSVYVFLAHTIADMWRMRLKDLFPIREFIVGVDEEQVGPEVYAYSTPESH